MRNVLIREGRVPREPVIFQYQEPLIAHLWGGGSQGGFLEEVAFPSGSEG